MKKILKKLIPNLILLGLSTLFILLAAEFVLGLFHVESSGGFRRQKLFCRFDSVLGWTKIPNYVSRHVTDEYSITETMNSKGLRGPEYSYDKPTGEFRILVLGDSFAEGRGVEFEEIFSEVMKSDLKASAELEKSGRSYQVINAGTGGYSTDQELLFFEREGRKYSPDLVILQFCDNDIWYNARSEHSSGSKPLFRLGEDGTVSFENVLYPKQSANPPASSPAPASTPGRVQTWLRTRSRVYNLLREGLRNIPYVSDAAVKLRLLKPKEWSLPDELRVWKKEYDKDTLEAWELTGALLAKLQKAVSAEGDELMVFLVPPWATVYGKDFKKARGYYKVGPDLYPEKVAVVLKTLCEKNGIQFLDPTGNMKETTKTARTALYFKNDGHWTVAGHKVVGGFLSQSVRAYESTLDSPGERS